MPVETIALGEARHFQPPQRVPSGTSATIMESSSPIKGVSPNPSLPLVSQLSKLRLGCVPFTHGSESLSSHFGVTGVWLAQGQTMRTFSITLSGFETGRGTKPTPLTISCHLPQVHHFCPNMPFTTAIRTESQPQGLTTRERTSTKSHSPFGPGGPYIGKAEGTPGSQHQQTRLASSLVISLRWFMFG